MGNYIITLRTPEQIEIPEEQNGRDEHVLATLIKYIDGDRLEYKGWDYDRGGDIDNGEESGAILGQDETFFEVRCEFPDSIQFEEPMDVLPQLHKIILASAAHVSNLHEYPDKDEVFTKTIVEITLS